MNQKGKNVNKKAKKWLVAVLVLIAVVGAAATIILVAGGGKPKEGHISENDFLSVSGTELVNRDGDTVKLRGVNLGGWLIQECWMCPVTGEDGQWANLDTIEAFEAQGLTEDQIQQLFDTYQDNWITDYDLDKIAETGANCVRVPFWYRNFMKNEAGDWINDDLDQNPGFKRLDWVIAGAKERGMYVILDLHGAPGGQSMNHCCGTLGRNDLYTSAECRAAMKKLWTAIAERYRGEPAVAAYDLMNEPQNNDGFEQEPNYKSPWDAAAWQQTNDVYREMVAAVRAVDPDHVISLEGIWRIENLPYPEEEGWTNMLYQVHLYDDTDQFRDLVTQVAKYGRDHGVATLVGEFSNMDGIGICEGNGVNWTTWTYKGGKGSNGTWFWCYASPDPVDSSADDFDTALEKWGECLRTENGFNFSRMVYDHISELLTSD